MIIDMIHTKLKKINKIDHTKKREGRCCWTGLGGLGRDNRGERKRGRERNESDESLVEVILDGGMTRSERRRKGEEQRLVGKRG